MNIAKFVLSSAIVAATGFLCLAALAEDEAAPAAKAAAPAVASPGTQYSAKGADTCLECHDADSDTANFTTAGIFKGKHGNPKNAHSPFGQKGMQCEACHGPGDRHSTQKSKRTETINSLKANSWMPVAERNEVCLSCHLNRSRNAWHAEVHDRNQLACTDCHKLHVGKDPVLVKQTESEVCFTCHKKQRADFQKTSSHPVRFGKMACSDCHNTHGTATQALLKKPTLNQTCYSCHAEKRGPLMWEHAPVTEDCSLCHTSHGSVRTALLNKSTPSLCQECHSVAGHPAVPRTGAALPANGGTGAIFVVAGSCTNCHTQVHGSNHPSGNKLLR
ncbi:DmsE family decaheme c-type cytochrome [Niveibacterium umoris]|uniref:DmsE family decaheme c-type cytochrome n=1 Tax=Niveibacterium umoris TaxID=1193620 RepID=A0A840BRJ8_9RHOO|nr:DmsE family decaheme c-type cytochrome [Niveibacterium umoris]MBB4014158.1 DmsE family decaheme c-type cytochrome [Niveibacterium umoris]